MINKEKIKAKVRKAIKKLPNLAIVKRAEVNEFGERIDNIIEVCEIEGLYHEKGVSSPLTKDKGEIDNNKKIYFLVVYDEISSNIKKGDFIYIKDKKYIIKNLGNVNEMDIYLDMLIEVVV